MSCRLTGVARVDPRLIESRRHAARIGCRCVSFVAFIAAAVVSADYINDYFITGWLSQLSSNSSRAGACRWSWCCWAWAPPARSSTNACRVDRAVAATRTLPALRLQPAGDQGFRLPRVRRGRPRGNVSPRRPHVTVRNISELPYEPNEESKTDGRRDRTSGPCAPGIVLVGVRAAAAIGIVLCIRQATAGFLLSNDLSNYGPRSCGIPTIALARSAVGIHGRVLRDAHALADRPAIEARRSGTARRAVGAAGHAPAVVFFATVAWHRIAVKAIELTDDPKFWTWMLLRFYSALTFLPGLVLLVSERVRPVDRRGLAGRRVQPLRLQTCGIKGSVCPSAARTRRFR